MQFLVLLSLRVTLSTWTPDSSHMVGLWCLLYSSWNL